MKDQLLDDLEVLKQKIADQRDTIEAGALLLESKDQEMASKLTQLFGG